MAVVVYKSTDSSAPVLDGQAGSLVNVLDACLVNGYGSKAAAGWSIAFTTTNKRVYRMGSPSGGVPPRQMDLDVDDTGPNVTSTTKEARIRGYDQASGIGAGSNAFPAAATNICVRKSSATGATTRPWVVIADATTVYIFSQTGDVASVYYSAMFGEFYSYVSGDNYKTIICGRAENDATRGGGVVNAFSTKTTTTQIPTAVIGNYAARNYAGLNVGGQCAKSPFYPYVPIYAFMGGEIEPYPNPSDGAIIMAPVGVYTQTPFGLHGEMRGMFYLPHPNTMASNFDTFSGSGALAGRTFIIISLTDKGEVLNNGPDGYMCIETTDWPRST